jgi:hypothetical protein
MILKHRAIPGARSSYVSFGVGLVILSFLSGFLLAPRLGCDLRQYSFNEQFNERFQAHQDMKIRFR